MGIGYGYMYRYISAHESLLSGLEHDAHWTSVEG
jgi:hypothetical protein